MGDPIDIKVSITYILPWNSRTDSLVLHKGDHNAVGQHYEYHEDSKNGAGEDSDGQLPNGAQR